MNTKTIWEQHGFHTLTPIQEKTQELIKEGTDVVAISPTGTGKTLAYVVPILERVKADKNAASFDCGAFSRISSTNWCSD